MGTHADLGLSSVLSCPHLSSPPVLTLSPPPQLRAATVVGIPKISRYTDFFQNSVFLEAKGGALLYVQKSVQLGKTWQNLVKLGKKGVNPNSLVAALLLPPDERREWRVGAASPRSPLFRLWSEWYIHERES